jgi:phospholipid/cholesterol/gamma-HCH transport system substrate-binding protein
MKPDQEVRIGGVRVGSVTGIELMPNYQVDVAFSVSDVPDLPSTVEAAIRYKNLVGDRYLELLPGATAQVGLANGGTIPLERTRPAVDLDVLVGGFKPLFRTLDPEQVNSLTGSIVAALQGESGAIATLMASTASLTATLADRDEVIGEVITKLRDAFAVIDSRDQTVSSLIDQLQGLVTGLSDGRDPVSAAIVHINALTSSAAALLNQVRPDLRESLPKLEQASASLNKDGATIERTLQNLPETYRGINRISVSGDVFTAYLCNLRISTTGLNGQDIYTPWLDSGTNRCNGKPLN